jgi:hypothetical protein
MKLAAEALRAEARQRLESKEQMNLRVFKSWIEAADWIEEQDIPDHDGPYLDEVDVIAEALRAWNMRAHPDQGWDALSDQGKQLWRERAVEHLKFYKQAIERRSE